jgi:hypothetical protein
VLREVVMLYSVYGPTMREAEFRAVVVVVILGTMMGLVYVRPRKLRLGVPEIEFRTAAVTVIVDGSEEHD